MHQQKKWPDEHIQELCEWTKEKHNYYFALSNPCFEYWLLLHFENPSGNMSKNHCCTRLKRYLPDYDKTIPTNIFTDDNIDMAIKRAETQLSSLQGDWPKTTGTTVYKLINHIKQAQARHHKEK